MVDAPKDTFIYVAISKATLKATLANEGHPLKSIPETTSDGGKSLEYCKNNAICPLAADGPTSLAVLLENLKFSSEGNVIEVSTVLIHWLTVVAIFRKGCNLSDRYQINRNNRSYWGQRSVLCDTKSVWQDITRAFPRGVKRPLNPVTEAMRCPGFVNRLIRTVWNGKIDLDTICDTFYQRDIRTFLGVNLVCTKEKTNVSSCKKPKRNWKCAEILLRLSGVDKNAAHGMCILAAVEQSMNTVAYTGLIHTGKTSPLDPEKHGSKNVYTHVRMSLQDLTPELSLGRLCDVIFDCEHYLISAPLLYLFTSFINNPTAHISIGHKHPETLIPPTAYDDKNTLFMCETVTVSKFMRYIGGKSGKVVVYGDWSSAFFTAEGIFFQLLIRAAYDPMIAAVSVHTARPDMAVSHGGEAMELALRALYHVKRDTSAIQSAMHKVTSITPASRLECMAKIHVDPIDHTALLYPILTSTVQRVLFGQADV